jgi:Family of unknown function (DUF6152)
MYFTEAQDMKRQVALLGFFSALLLASTPLFAHHGFAGRYDEANPITITGTVVELQLINPHSQIIFEVKGADGQTQRWHAELGGANAIRREGWGKETLPPGTKITIVGPAAKNGTYDMNLSHESRITLTDSGKVIHDSMHTGNANLPPAPAPAGGGASY